MFVLSRSGFCRVAPKFWSPKISAKLRKQGIAIGNCSFSTGKIHNHKRANMAKERKIHENGLRIAVEGCGHGMLNAIYDSIERASEENNFVVDLLIICGDFQAIRNLTDLEIMSCPPKYRELGEFHDYYSGKRKAPVFTVFIGGNHESSSYNAELFHGGWVAPNIYYMGAANVIRLGNLRIGGISGIYKKNDYNRPHNERLPYNQREIKSIYHIRQSDVFKLFQIESPVDIMLSHDWPANIEHHGNTKWLFQNKPWFKSDSINGELGSPPAENLLKKIKPRYWFSGHMHIKFSAIVDHGNSSNTEASGSNSKPIQDGTVTNELPAGLAAPKNPDELDLDLYDQPVQETPEKPQSIKNPDEIELELELDDVAEAQKEVPKEKQPVFKNPDELDLDDDDNGVPLATENTKETHIGQVIEPVVKPAEEMSKGAVQGAISAAPGDKYSFGRYTRFLSLDKCLPGRDFLQISAIDFPGPLKDGEDRLALTYDPEWLSIVRALNKFPGNRSDTGQKLRDLDPSKLQESIAAEREWIEENIVAKGKLNIPQNFQIQAPPYQEGENVERFPAEYQNNQTGEYCELLEIDNWVWGSQEEWQARVAAFPASQGGYQGNRGGGGGGGSGRRGNTRRGRGHGGGRGRGSRY